MQSRYSERVAAEVRANLARQGKKQSDLAVILNVSQQTASNRWNGVHPYTIDDLDAIARALDIPVEALITQPVLAAS